MNPSSNTRGQVPTTNYSYPTNYTQPTTAQITSVPTTYAYPYAYPAVTASMVPNTAANFLLTSSTANAMQQAYGFGTVPYVAPTTYGYPMSTVSLMTQPTSYGTTQPTTSRSNSSALPSSSLWIGDLEPWMDETFLWGIFGTAQDILTIKIIRDKEGKRPSAYGFIYFSNTVAAQRVLDTFNGQLIPPTTNKYFKLNFASPGAKADTKGKDGGAGSLFVGDLAAEVNDSTLMMTFKNFYPSVISARIVYDNQTGQPKGYGFVTFGNESEKIRALNEMQGYYVGSRPIKVNIATKKADTSNTANTNYPNMVNQPSTHRPPRQPQTFPSPTVTSSYNLPVPTKPARVPQVNNTPLSQHQQQQQQQQQRQRKPNNLEGENDPNNLTIFIGGIDTVVHSYEALKSFFSVYGEILNIKFPAGKTCAFVEFKSHESAVQALRDLGTSTLVDSAPVRLAWGKPSTPSNSSSTSSQGTLPEKRKLDDTKTDDQYHFNNETDQHHNSYEYNNEEYNPSNTQHHDEDDEGNATHDKVQPQEIETSEETQPPISVNQGQPKQEEDNQLQQSEQTQNAQTEEKEVHKDEEETEDASDNPAKKRKV